MSLITYQKQQAIKPISGNNEDKYDILATEVENIELGEVLGIDFLQDIQTNPTSYTDLINGSTFENCRGNNITHKGLVYVLAYLIYSKYASTSKISDTFSGFVQKNRPDSTQLPEGEIRRIQEDNRKVAFHELEIIKSYLNANKEIYPLWSDRFVKVYTPKIKGIKRVNYGR